MPDSGDVHGMVKSVHGWLTRHDYSAYTVMRSADRPLRVVALTDAPSGMTLAARLLPFIGNSQSRVEGATLVYQTGGFSVYEIPPERSEEHTSELQSLMRISYAVFCLKKKNKNTKQCTT